MSSHGQVLAYLVRKHHARVLDTWLTEFAYPDLNTAVSDRGVRIDRELDVHAKRLADRSQMGPTRMQGRSGVIR